MIFLLSFLFLASCATNTAQEEFDRKWQGSIDREAVRQVIRNNKDKIKTCYKDGLKKQPDDNGKVMIRFEVDDKGKVRSSKVTESALKNKEVGECVSKVIQEQKFPETHEGVITVIDFPFFFDKMPEAEKHNML